MRRGGVDAGGQRWLGNLAAPAAAADVTDPVADPRHHRRAIATAHGAALTTRARPGGGLHVEVSFPVSKAVAAQQDSRAAEAGAGVVGF